MQSSIELHERERAGSSGTQAPTLRESLTPYAVGTAAVPAEVRALLGESAPVHVYVRGNRDLLGLPWTAFLCSSRCPGELVMGAYDLAQRLRATEQPVVGGFHGPVEREVLKVLLRSAVPVCLALARGLPRRVPPELRRPLEDGRLLLLSSFDERMKRATQEAALQRNFLVAALAATVIVAHAEPGSKTEQLCRRVAGWRKCCLRLASPRTENLGALGFKPWP